jgi:hypothetical protein
MYNSSSSRWKTSRRGHLKDNGMTGTIIFKWIPEKKVVKSRTVKWKKDRTPDIRELSWFICYNKD